MRLELGRRVECTDGSFGELTDVVIDPATRRVTHLVVEHAGHPWLARLVPVELVERAGGASGAIALRATAEEVRSLPQAHAVAYVRLDGFPVDDPDWDVGVEEVLARPLYPWAELAPTPIDYTARYDRVPEGEVEIRRASDVRSAAGRRLGSVEGFVVDDDRLITHVVLAQGQHPRERRGVLIPRGAVTQVETDSVTVSLTEAEVTALPPVALRHRPRPLEGRPRR
jgi:sporulation protein YlmC with PRC-barrel domain